MGHKRAVVLGVRFNDEMERDAKELGLYRASFPYDRNVGGYYSRGYEAVRARLAGEPHVAEKYVDALAKLEDADRVINAMVGRAKALQARLKKAEKAERLEATRAEEPPAAAIAGEPVAAN